MVSKGTRVDELCALCVLFLPPNGGGAVDYRGNDECLVCVGLGQVCSVRFINLQWSRIVVRQLVGLYYR